jgi:uncharacterized cupredoxin-like copper-binding protein
MKTLLLFSALMSSALALPAYADSMHMHGKPAAKVDRTIAIDMNDTMRFTPAQFTATQGETIRFVVRNSGRMKHEMVIGSIAELNAHAEMMRKMPGMAHAESNQVGVAPGQTGEIVWQFTKAGSYDFACLEPGHFEAGMKGRIAVKERS